MVYLDERIKKWSLKLGVEPDSACNVKYMNHAVGLLHGGNVEIVKAPNASSSHRLPPTASAQLEWLWANCKVVYWPKDDRYPIEHNPHAKKYSRDMIEAEMPTDQAQRAPD
jgi:hypothetical protein